MVKSKKEQTYLSQRQRELDEKLAVSINRVQSIWDKVSDIDKVGDTVVSNYILEQKAPGAGAPLRRYEFGTMKNYADWKKKHLEKYRKKLQQRLTPHEFFITQNGEMERAFTGEYYWMNEVGQYECKCCSQKLFMWDHKFINKSGYATFWNCIENAVKYVDDKLKVNVVSNAHESPTLKGKMPVKRAVCSNVRNFLP